MGLSGRVSTPARTIHDVGFLTLWWLPGIADTDAAPGWMPGTWPGQSVNGVARIRCRVVIEVDADRWQAWSGVEPGHARADVIA